MRFLALVPTLIFLTACGDDAPPPTDGGMDATSDSALECEVPEEMCGTRCINTQNDGRNCGACGMECAAGSFCSAGACSRTCPSGTVPCGGSCADLATDTNHCGACDMACADDEACRGGSCTCPEGHTRCDGACINPDSNPDNCGVCGRSCDADQICNMGMCSCAAGARETECNDMLDDDCDGMIDCEDPDCMDTTRSCMGSCGTEMTVGVETCDGAGTWGECVTGSPMTMEICGDGIDQDCDGADLRNPDMYEPNNDCSECALLTDVVDPMITITASFDSVEDTVDCFRFIANDGFSVLPESIQIDLTDIPVGHDYDVFLYRDLDECVARNALVSGIRGSNDDENLSWSERFSADDGGTYYIRVTRFRGNSCTDEYTLSVDGLN